MSWDTDPDKLTVTYEITEYHAFYKTYGNAISVPRNALTPTQWRLSEAYASRDGLSGSNST